MGFATSWTDEYDGFPGTGACPGRKIARYFTPITPEVEAALFVAETVTVCTRIDVAGRTFVADYGGWQETKMFQWPAGRGPNVAAETA